MSLAGLLLLGLLSFVLSDKVQVDRHKGVPFTRKSLYEGTEFGCLDGSATIPSKYINDDYCDCADGSDEPGTSACPHDSSDVEGNFHCVNVGHRGVNVPSSRVNDGICDCCDGSDEHAGKTNCANNCDEIGRAAREEAERRSVAQREGFGKRAELIKEAARLKEEKEKQLETWKAEKETLDSEKDDLNMAKQDAEKVWEEAERRSVAQRECFGKRAELIKEAARQKEEKELETWKVEKGTLDLKKADFNMTKHDAEKLEKDAKDIHSEAWKATKEERRVAKAEAAFAALDADGDGILKAEELIVHAEFDKDGDGKVTIEEAQYYILGKEQTDKATFVADIWDGITPVYGRAPSIPDSPPAPPTGERIDDAPPNEDTGDEDEPGDDEVEDFDSAAYLKEGEAPQPLPVDEEEEPEPEYDEATKALITAADEARTAFDEADRKLRDIDNNIKDADDLTTTDFGPDNVFWPLKGQCAEMTDNQYTYKFCPFDKATQRDKTKSSGGKKVMLVVGIFRAPRILQIPSLRSGIGEQRWRDESGRMGRMGGAGRRPILCPQDDQRNLLLERP